MSEAGRLAAGATIQRWSLPPVEGPIVGRRRTVDPAAEEKARAEQQANHARGYEAGYEAGHRAGMAAAQAEMQPRIAALDERIRRLDSILQFLAHPLEELDATVERELVQLVLAVGKQLARRELTIDPAQIIAIIRESLARLPASARDVRVHLHPEDAAVVRERLASPASERSWSIVEDPTLSRGGCVVRTETSQIDARLESRVAAVIGSVLGEERSSGREGLSSGEDEE